MSRGFQRQEIYSDDKDREHFLELLTGMVERYGVVLHAYALMANHYHLLVETPNANASRALQWLNVSYSVWFNRRHGRTGALFQARYKSVPVEGVGEWALACATYIHLNPVRIHALGLDKAGRARENAGVATATGSGLKKEHLRRLRGYVWGSYRAYAGYVKAPAWLTCGVLWGRTGSDNPAKAYRKHILLYLGDPDALNDSMEEVLVLGGEAFKERMRRLALQSHNPHSGNASRWKRLLPFQTVVACMEKFKGEPWESFANRRGDWGRDMVLYTARLRCGLTLPELGLSVEMRPSAVSQSVSRFSQRLACDTKLSRVQSQFQQFLEERSP